MKRSFSGIVILLALVLSACGANSPEGIRNGGTITTQTVSTSVTTTDTTGTSPTAMPGTTDAVPTTGTMGSMDTTATTGVADPMLTPNPDGTSMPGSTAMPTSMAASPNGDIEYVLANDPRFSTLAKAVDVAQLADTLRASGPITLFAPTNEAFAALPAGQLEQMLADPTALTQLLGYHVVSGNMRTSDIGTMMSIPTLSGQSIQISKSGNDVMLNGNTLLSTTDITTTNGVIHVLDTVLTPTN